MAIFSRVFGLFKSKHLIYGYANARVKSRKAKILQWENFEDFSNQGTVDGVIAMLERTYYKDVLGQATLSSVSRAEMVELAAGIHYAEVVGKVWEFAPEKARPAIAGLMRKWDFINLKLILASRRTGKSWEEMRPYIIPAGTIGLRQLEGIARAEGEKIFMEVRRTDLGREIFGQASSAIKGTELEQMFIQSVRSAQVLNQLQVLLDTAYYNYLATGIDIPDKDAQALQNIVRKEIDARNIVNVLRLAKAGVKSEETARKYMIQGGTMRHSVLKSLLGMEDIAAVLPLISHTLPVKGEVKTLVDLEMAFKQEIAREKIKRFYTSTVSLGTILSFLFIKEEEMNNLRRVVRGIDYRLSPEEIRATLVAY
jgi:V/A-type H+-transporting ATPase subunit C